MSTFKLASSGHLGGWRFGYGFRACRIRSKLGTSNRVHVGGAEGFCPYNPFSSNLAYFLSKGFCRAEGLLHSRRHSAVTPLSWRREVVGPRFGSEEQLLEIGPGHPLQSSPLLNRKEYRGVHASSRHDLWTFGKGIVKKLAES